MCSGSSKGVSRGGGRFLARSTAGFWRRLSTALAVTQLVATVTAMAVGGGIPANPASTVSRGWQQVSLPDKGSYFLLYVPSGWDPTRPAPLVLFLHGAGASPEVYKGFIDPAADGAGALVAAPKASGIGWGTATDEQSIAATLAAAKSMVAVDPARVSIAGHSAGGAYAYLLAYGSVGRYSAVFSMSAPFYPVSAVADPAYKAPIHMYYGTTDPNYTGGSRAALEQQWRALGVPFETDAETGYGHSFWPAASMASGFSFLVSKSYGGGCVADATHLCLRGGRFRVAVAWQDGNGRTGDASPAAAVAADSGVLWFFDPTNWEMLVKVLDGCALNQRIWVFAAATTNVQYTLTVTDVVTGQARSYQNPGGQAAAVIQDTGAFASCP